MAPQVSRCVPITQNSRQGQAIGNLQKKWKAAGKTSFLIGFGNPGANGVNYCNNQACINDGFEVQNKKLSKRDVEHPVFKYYRTRAGMILGSIDMVEYPSNYTRLNHEAEALDDSFAVWTEVDDENGEMRFVEDTVVEELPWDFFLH